MPNETLDTKRHIYSVAEITQDIKLILENTFAQVWVEGEVSNFRPSQAGHLYFSLKDKDALLNAVIFARAAAETKFKLEDGLKVICYGKVDVYPPRGQYQLIIEKVEPKGIGSLQLALEQLKKRLEKEGLFAQEHKRPIPYLPSRIGLVTSISGAAIKDILKVLDRRFGDIHVVINPVQVQGDAAKDEIASAIEEFNRYNENLSLKEHIEVLIVGRGGGSIEDLWAFNEEVVARAIYNSGIPVISAVGHERDWTVADLVADMRAPTPSSAAELVVPEKIELREQLEVLVENLNISINHRIELLRQDFLSAQKKLSLLNPVALLEQHKERVLDLARQIFVRMEHLLKLRSAGFNTLIEKLSSLSPLNILARGYSITFKMPQGEIIKNIRVLKTGDTIKTRLHKGEIISRVTEVN
ncbi:MAG: exodeoxyribonuclease VII large subunit [Candidatus Omnitrophota bacterium]|jgi:exodeoxyribonuclease VII large subunit